MTALLALIASHGTRILGLAQGTVALLCGMSGIIPDAHMKYWLAASAVLTFWRGQSTSNSYNRGVADGISGPPPFVPQAKNASADTPFLNPAPPPQKPLEPK